MRKSDVLGVLALSTAGLFALPGSAGVAAALFAVVATYLFSRSKARPTRRLLAAKLGTLRGLGARGR